jgi:DNA-binding PadR family transcriptional regulator
VRMHPAFHGSRRQASQQTAGEAHELAQLLAELASAGLVEVEVDHDGDISYALTPRGQQTALLMAMSRQQHALVLLGALMGEGESSN